MTKANKTVLIIFCPCVYTHRADPPVTKCHTERTPSPSLKRDVINEWPLVLKFYSYTSNYLHPVNCMFFIKKDSSSSNQVLTYIYNTLTHSVIYLRPANTTNNSWSQRSDGKHLSGAVNMNKQSQTIDVIQLTTQTAVMHELSNFTRRLKRRLAKCQRIQRTLKNV